MKGSCNFNQNHMFRIGLLLMCTGLFVRNVLEVTGPVDTAACFLCGAGAGLAFLGLLYGSPKTRPLFDRLHAFKLRLLGRESAN